jgi:hypothetical protein
MFDAEGQARIAEASGKIDGFRGLCLKSGTKGTPNRIDADRRFDR